MPFKSEMQRRLFYAKAKRGEIPQETVEHWERETGGKKLPEKLGATTQALREGLGKFVEEAGFDSGHFFEHADPSTWRYLARRLGVLNKGPKADPMTLQRLGVPTQAFRELAAKHAPSGVEVAEIRNAGRKYPRRVVGEEGSVPVFRRRLPDIYSPEQLALLEDTRRQASIAGDAFINAKSEEESRSAFNALRPHLNLEQRVLDNPAIPRHSARRYARAQRQSIHSHPFHGHGSPKELREDREMAVDSLYGRGVRSIFARRNFDVDDFTPENITTPSMPDLSVFDDAPNLWHSILDPDSGVTGHVRLGQQEAKPGRAFWLKPKEASAKEVQHVFVTGAPGVGKTTAAQNLERSLGLPLVSLDGVDKRIGSSEALRFINKHLGDQPHIVEGAQILGFQNDFLNRHKVVLLEEDRNALVDRLVARGLDHKGGLLRGEGDRKKIDQHVGTFEGLVKKFKKRYPNTLALGDLQKQAAYPREEAHQLAQQGLQDLNPLIDYGALTGSLPRWQGTPREHSEVNDIDLLVVPKPGQAPSLPAPYDVYQASPEDLESQAIHWGSGKAIIGLKAKAKAKGAKLTRYGLELPDGNVVRDADQIYAFLGEEMPEHVKGVVGGWRAKGADWKDDAKQYAPLAAGAGLAAGAYGVLRRPSFTKNNPALRALQEAAQGKKFRFLTNRPEGAGLRGRLFFGAKDLSQDAALARKGESALDLKDSVVMHHGYDIPQRGAVNINAGALPGAMDDKGHFATIMNQVAPESIAKTFTLGEALNRFGSIEGAHKALGGKGYVIKPRAGALSQAEDLITEAMPLESGRVQQALRNPHAFIIQERLPIAQEFRVHSLDGDAFTATHRNIPHEGIRRLWNNATERLGLGRGGFSHIPVVNPAERERLYDFVNKSQRKLVDTGTLGAGGEHFHAAYDVARLDDGTYRLIEANPVPGSMMNPIIARKLQRQATGQWGRDVALAGAGSAGLAGTLGAGVAMNKDAAAPLGPPPEPNRKEYPYQGTIDFQGIAILVENKKGTYRRGKSKAGTEWKNLMPAHYGEFEGSRGTDGDPLDVFVGPHDESTNVYIVHTKKPPTFTIYDEDKVMLGFTNAADAKATFLKAYDDKRFFGHMSACSIEDLKKLLAKRSTRGKKMDQELISEKAAEFTANVLSVANKVDALVRSFA